MSRLACALCLICLLGGVAAQSVESNTVEDQAARNARGRLGAGGGASGAARSVLAEIARELITRSSTSSQVLSLNLTNLVILLVLKAIIFGAGSMGLGWAGKGAREAGEAGRANGLVSEQEAILVLSFLMGGERDGYSCLNRVACQEPDAANSYARAAMLLTKGAKMMSGMIPYDDKFESITEGLAEAVEFGRSGHPCEERYTCSRSR